MSVVDDDQVGETERPDHGVPVPAPRATPSASTPVRLAPWRLDQDRLTEVADEWSSRYRAATPFPHVVLDSVLPDALLDELINDFPAVDDAGWTLHEEATQRKQQWRDVTELPALTASVIGLLQAAPFLTFLGRLTGIEGLIGDPHCHHGGLHQILDGGFLKVHTDAAAQPALHLQRRVNMIVFLNRDWSAAWGGHLELWDSAMTTCVERIEPQFNRMVVFDTVGSHHGHPDPIKPPPGVLRRSLALYYYVSPTHPSALSAAAERRSTFRARPGESLPHREPPAQRPSRWREVARDLLPPVVARLIRRPWRRWRYRA
jgi:hypothetical protein